MPVFKEEIRELTILDGVSCYKGLLGEIMDYCLGGESRSRVKVFTGDVEVERLLLVILSTEGLLM